MLTLIFSVTGRESVQVNDSRRQKRASARAHEALAEAVDEIAIVRGHVLEKAVDRFHDHTPLRETSNGTHCVEPGLELEREADAELWVVLHLLSLFRTCGWTTGSPTIAHTIVRHDRWSWRRTAETREFRAVSSSCERSA